MLKIIESKLSACRKAVLFYALSIFTIALGAQPVITSFSPTSGNAGTTVTLTGSGFNTTKANNVVRLGGMKCSVQNVSSATSMTVTIPANVTRGRFTITNTATKYSGTSKTEFVVKYPSTVGYNYRYSSSTVKSFSLLSTALSMSYTHGGGNNLNAIDLADMDDDGKIDIIVADVQHVKYYRNTSTSGTISFATASNLVSITSSSANQNGCTLQVFDYDNDGDLDIVMWSDYAYSYPSPTATYTYVFENTGSITSPSFSQKQKISDGNSILYYNCFAEPADYNLDGYLDLCINESYWGKTANFHMGSSSTTSPFSITSVQYNNNDLYAPTLATLNINDDSKLDLVESQYNTNNTTGDYLTMGVTAGGTLSKSNITKGSYTGSSSSSYIYDGNVVTGDLNNDGLDDIIRARGSSNMYVFQNQYTASGGVSWSSAITLSTGNYVDGFELTDLNNDGYLDIIYQASNGSNVQYVRMNTTSSAGGTISFGSETVVSYEYSGLIREMKLADFDGDGFVEFCGIKYNSTDIRVFQNILGTLPYSSVSESFTNFNRCSGGTITPQSFTVSGGNLSADLVVTAPTNFELSTSSTGTYSSSVTLTRSSGSVSTTTLYVRLKSSATGASSGTLNVTMGAGGTNLYSKTIAGTVDLPTISGTTSACPSGTSTLTGSGTAHSTTPWSSATTSVATINTFGVVTAVATGTSVITYTNSAGCTNTATFTVSAVPSISGTTSVCPQSTNTLTGSGTAASTNPWVSSNTSIFTVSNSGVITGVALGSATVTYTSNQGSACSASSTISVVASPTISGSSDVCQLATTTLVGSGTARSTTPWTSSSTSVATVTTGGVVSGVAGGTSTITYYNNIGCPATQVVTVTAAPTISGTLSVDRTLTTTLTGSGTAATTNPWASASTSVATVSSSGVVTGVSAGTSVITYTSSTGCSRTATVTVNAIDYYIKSTGASAANTLTNWTLNNNGTGANPSNWDAPKIFHFSNSSGTTSFTTGGNWTVGGTIDIPSGKTLNLTSGSTLTVSGTGILSNLGTISGSGATLDFTGTVAQTLTGGLTIGTIKSNNTAGVTLAASPMTITNGSATGAGVMKLDRDATITNLTINNGTVDINGYSLTVNGSLSQNSAAANCYIQAGTSGSPKKRSKFVFAPSSTFADTIFINPNANTFRHFEIGSGSVNAAVTLGNDLSIKGGDNVSNTIGVLKIKSGSKVVIPNGRSLTLKCDTMNGMLDLAGSASSMIECTGTGKFKIERDYLGKRGWRIYAHPFNTSIDLQQVADDIEVIGRNGISEGFQNNLDTNASAYWYNYNLADSSTSTDAGWVPFTSAKGTSISGNPNLWHQHRPVIIFNTGARKGPGFGKPSDSYYRDSVISLDYTLGSTIHLNDGNSQSVATPTIPNASKYFYITNPFTAPVKLKDITNLNSTYVEPYFYYWMQRRNAVDASNFMPAQWNANLITNGNTTRDDNICIPAFGAILVKLKPSVSSVTFTIPESAKQLTNFDYVIGGSTGVSRTNLMFMERTLPKHGAGGIELSLMVNDSQMVDEMLVYDMAGQSTAANGMDAVKYIDNTFPNVFALSPNKKALNLDMQDISARLKTAEDVVEIPLGIAADYTLNHKKVTLVVTEKNSNLQMFFKNNKTGAVMPAELFDALTVNFSKAAEQIEHYSLLFRRSTLNNENIQAGGGKNQGVLLYPNPVANELTLEVASNKQLGNYQLLDMMGRVLMTGSSTTTKANINVSDLAAGEYIIRVGGNSSLFIKK